MLRRFVLIVTAYVQLSLLFVTVVSAAPLPSTSLGLPADYRIHPGDVVMVSVFGEANLSEPAVKVLPSGTIVLPLAGEVVVGGLTPEEAGNAVARRLAKYLRQPQVALSISAVGQDDVYVLGNVKLPGKYTLDPQAHIMDAIAAAGGLGPVDGKLPDARVSTTAGAVQEVSLEQMLHQGDLTLNLPVQNQMAIYVPAPPTFDVVVNGAVDHPGDVPLHDGDRLLVAIGRAGTSTSSSADLNHVHLQHTQPDGTVQTQIINLYDVINKGENDKDPVMHKGDIVFVPQGAKSRDNTGILYLLGNFLRL